MQMGPDKPGDTVPPAVNYECIFRESQNPRLRKTTFARSSERYQLWVTCEISLTAAECALDQYPKIREARRGL